MIIDYSWDSELDIIRFENTELEKHYIPKPLIFYTKKIERDRQGSCAKQYINFRNTLISSLLDLFDDFFVQKEGVRSA